MWSGDRARSPTSPIEHVDAILVPRGSDAGEEGDEWRAGPIAGAVCGGRSEREYGLDFRLSEGLQAKLAGEPVYQLLAGNSHVLSPFAGRGSQIAPRRSY
jgi:hypothetical protein